MNIFYKYIWDNRQFISILHLVLQRTYVISCKISMAMLSVTHASPSSLRTQTRQKPPLAKAEFETLMQFLKATELLDFEV